MQTAFGVSRLQVQIRGSEKCVVSSTLNAAILRFDCSPVFLFPSSPRFSRSPVRAPSGKRASPSYRLQICCQAMLSCVKSSRTLCPQKDSDQCSKLLFKLYFSQHLSFRASSSLPGQSQGAGLPSCKRKARLRSFSVHDVARVCIGFAVGSGIFREKPLDIDNRFFEIMQTKRK